LILSIYYFIRQNFEEHEVKKKLKEVHNGVLKVNGQIAFRYFLYGLGCNIQSVMDVVVIDEWQIERIKMEIRD